MSKIANMWHIICPILGHFHTDSFGAFYDFLDRLKISFQYFFFGISKNSKKTFQIFFFSRDIEDEDERLRVYQLDRLKYYYAVCETDSPETADEIYKEFDGQDYGDSGVNGKILLIRCH